MNTIDSRGVMKMNLADAISSVKFPTVDDMSVNGKIVIDRLRKLIDESDDKQVIAGLEQAVLVVQDIQKTAYQEFLAQCKLTQV